MRVVTGQWGYLDGTFLQGYIWTDYESLRKAFGDPDPIPAEKFPVEWAIVGVDGTVATIYGRSESAKRWHIGGMDETAVELVSCHVPGECMTWHECKQLES